MSIHGNPVALLKFQMAPKLILLISSGCRKKEPRYISLSEAKASHSHKMWAKVSSFTPHSRLASSPNRWRCLLRVLCPVRRPVTALAGFWLCHCLGCANCSGILCLAWWTWKLKCSEKCVIKVLRSEMFNAVTFLFLCLTWFELWQLSDFMDNSNWVC